MSTVGAEDTNCEEEQDLDFPLPFNKLPPDIQEAAIENFRKSRNFYDGDDNDFLQEDLGEVLEYEFGLEPAHDTFKGKDGKQHKGKPRIYWDAYNQVEFEVASFDIAEVLKHGGDKEALDKEHGTCYFKPEARELAALLAEVVLLEVELGAEFNARYSLTQGKFESCRVEWEWDQPCGDLSTNEACQKLLGRIDDALKDYYEAACSRLRRIIEDQQEYEYSDDGIREKMQNNDHWTFDEEGNLT